MNVPTPICVFYKGQSPLTACLPACLLAVPSLATTPLRVKEKKKEKRYHTSIEHHHAIDA